jgi:hypothetical protein
MKDQLDALREDVRDRKMRCAADPYYRAEQKDEDARFSDLGSRMDDLGSSSAVATPEKK